MRGTGGWRYLKAAEEGPLATRETATIRLVRLAGLLAWLTVALPAALQGTGRPSSFVVWLAGYLAFGALLIWTTSRLHRDGAALRIGLAAQAACVLTIVAVQCRGYEGILLVLIAMQLGLAVPRRTAVAWVVVQTLAMTWGIQHHWSLRPALLLTPPYLGFQLLAVLVFESLARESRGRAELARLNAELLSTRELLAQNARLSERLRIGRELHDSMGHHLVALSLNLQVLAESSVPSPPLETCRQLAGRLLDDVESVVTALADDPGLDLGQALATLAAAIPRPRIHVDARELALHDPERAHVLLRCCQEIITNSVKHAAADNLWISIRGDGGLIELTARDDGHGAGTPAPGHGLAGMRSRLEAIGGALSVETAPGSGFQLTATLPGAAPDRRTA
jgi:signal transduction histidine kinase